MLNRYARAFLYRDDVYGHQCATRELRWELNIGCPTEPHEDPEIKAIYNQHSNVDFDTSRDEDIQRLKAEAEAATGFDLGEDEGIRSEADLVERNAHPRRSGGRRAGRL